MSSSSGTAAVFSQLQMCSYLLTSSYQKRSLEPSYEGCCNNKFNYYVSSFSMFWIIWYISFCHFVQTLVRKFGFIRLLYEIGFFWLVVKDLSDEEKTIRKRYIISLFLCNKMWCRYFVTAYLFMQLNPVKNYSVHP